ncbi:hypothetical protein AOA59_25235 [Pseudomonas sp. 2822-15]|uniref:hypothetical protein n=1 Tax=Pseudomonas sp. 2822-15 TaxID=1712677 RepID=UPI000C152731|nr:hypothetical protein [Pseudomonas sp. 2822-15]PIB41177.1 hypothetical protein AOA59_25235 [Pseudomonas sp. 2822-15]
MAISLIRSLTASVVRNVSALKRDAKRLQKHSKLVFGTEYPLKVCQHAVSVSRGFRSLADVENLAQRLGLDKEAPFWTIVGRNDIHQDALNALYRLSLEYTENGPVVFLGEQTHSIVPALVLFIEQMSLRKLPGVILVETEASSIQDTLVLEAVEKLGYEEIFDGFRCLDLRDQNLPVSLSTEARCWVSAITDVLPKEVQKELLNTDWAMALEMSARESARSRNQIHQKIDFSTIPFYSVKEAAYQLVSSRSWPSWIGDDASQQARVIGECPPDLQKGSKESVLDLIRDLDNRSFELGISSEHESRWRPYVVLFSRHDPASEVLAGVVNSYFTWRPSRDERPPVLYVSDSTLPYAPGFLSFGGHTAVVNGLEKVPSGDGNGEFFGYKTALKVTGSPEGLQFMGKRVALA